MTYCNSKSTKPNGKQNCLPYYCDVDPASSSHQAVYLKQVSFVSFKTISKRFRVSFDFVTQDESVITYLQSVLIVSSAKITCIG